MGKDTSAKSKKPIVKSAGVNSSERVLARLCDRVFFKLWDYANPYKEPGVELCDVLAVFENHVFIFSIKNILFNSEIETDMAWDRWKRKAIDKSIRQIQGAEKWIRKNPEKIFLDGQCKEKFPLAIDPKNCKIHRIVVAFGAEEASKNDSSDNINGPLVVSYVDLEHLEGKSEIISPFALRLPRDEVIHVLDGYSLEIILGELDTVHDLIWYLEAKEEAIKKYDFISYYGEEELLAHYFHNFDEETQKHYIGTRDKKITAINLEQGFWQGLINHNQYKARKQENEESYLWDMLLQKVLQHKLDGELTGNADVFKHKSASVEMAKEPRFSRRALSQAFLKTIHDFHIRKDEERTRLLAAHSSFYSDCMYVFFHLWLSPNIDYEKGYRPLKRELLDIACGVVKNKYPHLKKVIGITIDIPEINRHVSEDLILLNCENWTKELEEHYEKANKETGLNFFGGSELKTVEGLTHDFPPE